MLNLQKSSTGMDLTPNQIKAFLKTVCPTCAQTKATARIPRDPVKRFYREKGRLIHVDTWGLYNNVAAYDGTMRIILFTDDATRFTWIARLKRKGDMVETFKKLHKYISQDWGINIRRYRFDGEFHRNGNITRWLAKKGVGFEPTTPDDHYENGVAER